MANANHILSRALHDRFHEVANPFKLAQDFCESLWNLVHAANRAFENGEKGVGGSWHYIMDLNEAALGTPMRPEGDKTIVVYLNIHDTCKSDLRSKFAPVPEPGQILTFHKDGSVVAAATKNALPDDWVKKVKITRSETYRVTNPNGIEGFVASWLRNNFDSKTMVEMQEQLNRENEKSAENFWLWTPQQRDRLLAVP